MGATLEMKYADLRQRLKEKYRKKIRDQETGISTTKKHPVNLDQRLKSCSFRKVVSMDHQLKVEKIRENRDYSFLFSDDPVAPTVRTTSSRNTMNNVVVVGHDHHQETKKPLSSIKIKIRYNKIALKDLTNQNGAVNAKEKNLGLTKNKIPVKELQDSGISQLKSLATKKPVRRYRSDDEYDEEEGEKALRMIREMYNTKRFAGRDDGDMAVETNYKELLKEERKSAKIARAEDSEQLRLIKEEERRKKSKKCKISH